MIHGNQPWIRRACLCVIGLVMLAGCSGDGDGRYSLAGTVALDGQPLAEGLITLRPQPGTPGPTAGGKISQGEFSISPQQGTFVGTFRVEITAVRETGRKVMDPRMGREMDEIEQLIPARYNHQSELTAEVTETGPNRFEFALTSQ